MREGKADGQAVEIAECPAYNIRLTEAAMSNFTDYIDPLMRSAGRGGIVAMIQGVQAQFPGLLFRKTSDVDAHNDRVRFSWELGPEGSPALAGGVDFGVVVGDRLQAITGFLDFAPKPAE